MTFSIRHLLLASFILVFFSLAVGNLIDPDLWWHLRTGQYIVETRTIPHTDIFSFTQAGSEWVAHEWLSEVIMYVTYSAFGAGGLILLFAILATTAFGLLFLRDTGHIFTAGAALLLSSLTAWPLFTPRPWLFSAMLTSLFLYGLDLYARNGKTWFLRFLPLLMILWVNLHGEFALGIALVFLYALGVAGDDMLEGKTAREITLHLYPLVLTWGACTLAILFNPNGFRMYSYPLETLGSPSIQEFIIEWASPDFHSANFQPFALQLLITLGALAFSGKARIRDLILISVFGYASLRASRNILIFALVSLPTIIDSIGIKLALRKPLHWLEQPTSQRRFTGAMNMIVLLVLLGGAWGYVRQIVERQPQVQMEAYPVQATTFIHENYPPAPLFNTYTWGGYLIWRLYPEYQVFIDGRSDIYNHQFLGDYVAAENDSMDGKALLEQYKIRTAIFPADNALATALSDDPDWRVIYKDRVAVVLTKK